MIDRWLQVVQYVPVDHMEIKPIEGDFYAIYYCEHYVGHIRASVLGRYLPW